MAVVIMSRKAPSSRTSPTLATALPYRETRTTLTLVATIGEHTTVTRLQLSTIGTTPQMTGLALPPPTLLSTLSIPKLSRELEFGTDTIGSGLMVTTPVISPSISPRQISKLTDMPLRQISTLPLSLKASSQKKTGSNSTSQSRANALPTSSRPTPPTTACR